MKRLGAIEARVRRLEERLGGGCLPATPEEADERHRLPPGTTRGWLDRLAARGIADPRGEASIVAFQEALEEAVERLEAERAAARLQ